MKRSQPLKISELVPYQAEKNQHRSGVSLDMREQLITVSNWHQGLSRDNNKGDVLTAHRDTPNSVLMSLAEHKDNRVYERFIELAAYQMKHLIDFLQESYNDMKKQ